MEIANKLLKIDQKDNENKMKAWNLACGGKTKELEEFIESTCCIDENTRIDLYGETHSLIMGAFRNKNYDTVEMLINKGGTIEEHEKEEIIPYINSKRINIMEELITVLVGTANTFLDEEKELISKEEYISKLKEKLKTYKNIIEK